MSTCHANHLKKWGKSGVIDKVYHIQTVNGAIANLKVGLTEK